MELAHQGTVPGPGEATVDLLLKPGRLLVDLPRLDIGPQQPVAEFGGILQEVGATHDFGFTDRH